MGKKRPCRLWRCLAIRHKRFFIVVIIKKIRLLLLSLSSCPTSTDTREMTLDPTLSTSFAKCWAMLLTGLLMVAATPETL